MTRSGIVLATIFLLTTFITGGAFAASDRDIVASFFPSSLIADPVLDGDPPPEQTFTFIRADLDGTGTANYIVAHYYNGMHGDIRVIDTAAASPAMVYDVQMPQLGGPRARLSAVDLDGDSRPEIHLSLPGSRGSEDWLFKWRDKKLTVFGPTVTDMRRNVHSRLGLADIQDIDGDGIPELIAASTDDNYGHPVYKLANGSYVRRGQVFFWRHLVRTTGDPNVLDTAFDVDTPGTYVVTVVNGDPKGNRRVTSGEVDVNELVLLDDNAFKRSFGQFTTSVQLLEGNFLWIEIAGAPGSELTISITKP